MHLTMTIESDGVQDYQRVYDVVQHCAESLEPHVGNTGSCRVLIARPHREGRHGALYSVRVDLVVSGEEIVVNRDHRFDLAHEDVLQAIKSAFDSARRKLTNLGRHRPGCGRTCELAVPAGNLDAARIEYWLR